MPRFFYQADSKAPELNMLAMAWLKLTDLKLTDVIISYAASIMCHILQQACQAVQIGLAKPRSISINN